jgi:hypothetical protein
MKKLLAVLVLVLIFATLIVPTLAEELDVSSSVASDALTVSQDIVVKINGVPVVFDVKPVIIQDRTMVPLRAIFEALGAIVTWDADTNTIYGSKDGSIIILQVANTKAFINSKELEMDVAPQIIDSRTLVPTRFVAEALSADVKWDSETSTVIITTDDTKQTAPSSEEK